MKSRARKINAVEDKIATQKYGKRDRTDNAGFRGDLFFEPYEQRPKRTHSDRDQRAPQQREIQTNDV